MRLPRRTVRRECKEMEEGQLGRRQRDQRQMALPLPRPLFRVRNHTHHITRCNVLVHVLKLSHRLPWCILWHLFRTWSLKHVTNRGSVSRIHFGLEVVSQVADSPGAKVLLTHILGVNAFGDGRRMKGFGRGRGRMEEKRPTRARRRGVTQFMAPPPPAPASSRPCPTLDWGLVRMTSIR